MGGWFNKEIRSVADLEGLKMRIPGLGGEVLKKAGGTPQTIPVSEIFTALQTGTIDATEWVGPFNDLAVGFHQAARYYYYPGWHEPSTALEGLVNKAALESLPEDLQQVVSFACQSANVDMLSEFTARNGDALEQLVQQGVEIREFPEDVVQALKATTAEVLAEVATNDELSERVYASFMEFFRRVQPWSDIGQRAILDMR